MYGLTIFLKSPIGSVGYVLLMLAFISLWFNRKIWLWGPLFALSFVCAYYGDIATIKALVPIGVLLLCFLSLTQEIPGFVRMFAVLIASCITLAMFGHFISGFHNIEFAHQWKASATSLPMNLYLNYDKPIAALFILGLLVPLIETARQWRRMLYIAVPWACMTCAIMLALAMFMQIVEFDPKLPSITFMFLIRQIFFVVIPEEALFRGFIQKEISQSLNNSASGILAVLVTALIYAFLHILMIPSLPFFIMAFTAGLLYGAVYQITERIEAAMFVHLCLNVVHFFFFTYPILDGLKI